MGWTNSDSYPDVLTVKSNEGKIYLSDEIELQLELYSILKNVLGTLQPHVFNNFERINLIDYPSLANTEMTIGNVVNQLIQTDQPIEVSELFGQRMFWSAFQSIKPQTGGQLALFNEAMKENLNNIERLIDEFHNSFSYNTKMYLARRHIMGYQNIDFVPPDVISNVRDVDYSPDDYEEESVIDKNDGGFYEP
jgi:hypothetical protein